MKRLNLGITENDAGEIQKAKELLGAASFTEAIRRSVRLTNKLLEFQDKNNEIIIRDKKSSQSVIIVA
jgi:hypothetical protein